jgi:hypothetical protein
MKRLPTPVGGSPLIPHATASKRVVSAPVTASPMSAGSRLLRAFTSPPTPADQAMDSHDLDPDDDSVGFNTVVPFECLAKPKHVVKSPASMLSIRPLHRQQSADVLSISGQLQSGPSTPGGQYMSRKPSTESLSDDQVLEDILSSDQPQEKNRGTLSKKEKESVPNLIAALTRRAHATEASTISSAASVAFSSAFGEVELEHVRDVSSSTMASTASNASTVKSHGTVRRLDDEESFLDLAGSIRGLASYGSQMLGSGFLKNRQFSNSSDSHPFNKSHESPHCKLKMRHGNKQVRSTRLIHSFGSLAWQLSVTVWFAKEFAKLRKSCDMAEDAFITSLSDCVPFVTSGGKTNASFYTTTDGRFILKQLVTRFSGSERESMLDIGPAYFDHYSSAPGKAGKPSLLAKVGTALIVDRCSC